jgi:hypothetical protein
MEYLYCYTAPEIMFILNGENEVKQWQTIKFKGIIFSYEPKCVRSASCWQWNTIRPFHYSENWDHQKITTGQ